MFKNLSIVIPAYNEEKRISKSINTIISYMSNHKKVKYEILVIDDGSTDNTYDILKKYKQKNIKVFRNSVNRGKGYSVRKGILLSKFDNILFSDSDLSTPIEMLERFWEYGKDEYDVLIASRHVKGSNIIIKQPIHRVLFGICFRYLVNIITGLAIVDTQCGFKMFHRKCINDIFYKAEVDRFAFDIELLIISNKLGYKIEEIPVEWYNDTDSKVSPIKDSIQMLIDVIKIKKRL